MKAKYKTVQHEPLTFSAQRPVHETLLASILWSNDFPYHEKINLEDQLRREFRILGFKHLKTYRNRISLFHHPKYNFAGGEPMVYALETLNYRPFKSLSIYPVKNVYFYEHYYDYGSDSEFFYKFEEHNDGGQLGLIFIGDSNDNHTSIISVLPILNTSNYTKSDAYNGLDMIFWESRFHPIPILQFNEKDYVTKL